MTLKKDNTIFCSVDIETDGPIPGDYSMLSIGAVAFAKDGVEVSSFYCTLNPLPDARQHPDTMKWWGNHQDAWKEVQKRPVAPATAMQLFYSWLKRLPGKPIFVGYPATFDFSFVYWYLIHFGHDSPFSFSAIDLKTYAYVLLDIPYNQMIKRNMPEEWFTGDKHSHHALEDAKEQGKIFIEMLKFRNKLIYNRSE